MDECILYDREGLFHQIVKQSKLFQGRYEVLANGYRDLDKGNLLDGIELPTEAGKYPMVATLPPLSFVGATGQDKARGLEYFSFRLLFLTRSGATGDNQILNRDPLTNTSMQRPSWDWSNMKKAALAFRTVLDELTDPRFYLDTSSRFLITRFTEKQRDGVNGVLVQFQMCLAMDCDVTDINVGKIQIPQ